MRRLLFALFALRLCVLEIKRLRHHKPERVPASRIAWRCRYCGKPAATEGELLGLDDEIRDERFYRGAAGGRR